MMHQLIILILQRIVAKSCIIKRKKMINKIIRRQIFLKKYQGVAKKLKYIASDKKKLKITFLLDNFLKNVNKFLNMS